MLLHKRLKISIEVQRQLENLSAENERLKGLLDYVAIMSDVEIPILEESEAQEDVSEN